MARIVDGVTTELRWPEIQLRRGIDASGLDVLLLVGPEPDFHWVEFAELVVGLTTLETCRETLGSRIAAGLRVDIAALFRDLR